MKKIFSVFLAVMCAFMLSVSAFAADDCQHIWSIDGACSKCGIPCTHDFLMGPTCMYCGFTCSHPDMVDGVCTVCSYSHTHFYESGVCSSCGHVCEHVWRDDPMFGFRECSLCYITQAACPVCGGSFGDDFLCLNGCDSPASSSDNSILSSVTALVTSAVDWVGDFVAAIVANPLLLAFVVVAFVGLGVGLIQRIKRL